MFILMAGYLCTFVIRASTYDSNSNFTTSVDIATDSFDFSLPVSVDRTDMISTSVFSISAAIVYTVAYSITFLLARKKLLHLSLRVVQSRDVVLLRIAVATFLMLIPSTVRSVVHIVSVVYDDKNLRLWASRQS
jgi:hypothetical protein